MDQTSFKLGEEKYSREDTNRLFIERQGLAAPEYRVLLFPHRTGEPLPTTTWDATRTRLTVDLGNGEVDLITCTRPEGDFRTRISVEHRAR